MEILIRQETYQVGMQHSDAFVPKKNYTEYIVAVRECMKMCAKQCWLFKIIDYLAKV